MVNRLSWETQKALEEAEEASDRARRVLIVMVVASILVFMAMWNSRYYGWTLLRLRAAESAELQHGRGRVGNARPSAQERQAGATYDAVQRLATERARFVSVPTLGFGVDVNDLGIIAGVAFAFLLMWLHFSIGRERMNVLELFRRARTEGTLRDAYELLAMTQVLSTPPNLRVHFRGSSWGGWTRVLFWVPAAVQAVVVAHDVFTFDIGLALSVPWAWVSLLSGVVLLLLMIWLTRDCWMFSAGLSRDWEGVFNEIYHQPQYFATDVKTNGEGRVAALANGEAGWEHSTDAVIENIRGGKAAYFMVHGVSGSRLRLALDDATPPALRTEPPTGWPAMPLAVPGAN